MGPEPYDRAAVAVNQIVKRDGFYYAFYHANSAAPLEGLDDLPGAVARPDPLGKVPGQPDHRQQLFECDPGAHARKGKIASTPCTRL